MPDSSQSSAGLSLLKRAHAHTVFDRRAKVLAQCLAEKIPQGSSVLDIGCGDGSIAKLIEQRNPGVNIRGIEFAPRPDCSIECLPFDGKTIPCPAKSFDVCMFVDVLHHAGDAEGIATLLAEAGRVSRHLVLIKDHLAESSFDFKTLQLMDWVGNRPYGVVLPYNYQNREQWAGHFAQSGLRVASWREQIPLYPFPFSLIFGRKLHFIALLEKTNLPLAREGK